MAFFNDWSTLASVSPPGYSMVVASKALDWWRGDGIQLLDEISDAHRAVGGKGRGRRYATGQLNNAYAVLLSSQFQRFCRDLHSEAAEFLTSRIDVALQEIIHKRFTEGRKLDVGNPNPANIGSDFARFGISFWDNVSTAHPDYVKRRAHLEQLNSWRNAIAHQDFTKSECGGRTSVRLAEVKRWRHACSAVAFRFDKIVAEHLRDKTGFLPW
jgi:hypothetical protein